MQFKHFLILDDDPLSSLLNEMVVIHAGRDLQFVTFHDPQDCLTHIRITPPTQDGPVCLLLDINMPKLNGWEFLTELESFPKEIQNNYAVVIVTSSTDDVDLIRVQEHPLVCGYLTKPVTVDRFKQLLDHLGYRASA